MDFIKEGLKRIIDNKWLTIVKPDFSMKWVKQFTINDNGLLLVSVLNEGFVVIFVNRLRHTICCCTTRGDKIDRYIWNDLCELKDHGKYFVCCAYRYNCKEYDEPFVLYLADFFTNGTDNVISRIPSDEEIIQMYEINVNGEVDQTSTNALQYKPRTLKSKKQYSRFNQPSINPLFESEEEKHYKTMSEQFPNNENFGYNYNKHRQIRKAGMSFENYNKLKQKEKMLQARMEQNPTNDNYRDRYNTFKDFRESRMRIQFRK